MKRIILALAVLALAMPAAAKQRTHVVVPKPLPARPPLTPISGGVLAIIPLAIAYDLQRRWTCTQPPPNGDGLGLGGPGFDRPVMPADGNVMIPACQRLYYKP